MSTIQIATPRRAAIDYSSRERLTVKTAVATVPYVFFLFANIYDMGGTHGLKYASYFLLIFLIPFARKPMHLSGQEALLIGSLFFAWPLISFFMGLLNGAEFRSAQAEATPFLGFFVALLIIPILGTQRVLRHLYTSILVMGIVTLVCAGLIYMNLGLGLITHIADYCSASYLPYPGGFREYRLYFEATLWLVPAAVYFAKTSRFPYSMLCLTALIISGSKAGAVIAFLFIAWVLLSVRKYRTIGVISIAIGVAAGLFFLPGFIQLTQDAFLDPNSSTLQVRLGHAASVIRLFAEKPWTILIGNGAGATFLSSGTGRWEVRMETDHLDAIWHYGLLWFVPFTLLCAWIIKNLFRSGQVTHKAHALALLSMYIAAGTNPQLISPLFMFYVASCFLMARRPVRSPSGVSVKQWGHSQRGALPHGEAGHGPLPSSELGVEGLNPS